MINSANRVRDYALAMDRNPSPQPSPIEVGYIRLRQCEDDQLGYTRVGWGRGGLLPLPRGRVNSIRARSGLTAICRRAIEQWALGSRPRPGKPPCPFVSTEAAPISPSDSRDFSPTKREVSADVEAATRAIVDDVAARGDAALIEATRKFDRLDLDAGRLARHRGRDRRGGEGLRRRDARRAEIRARPHRGLSSPAIAEGRSLHRRARRRTRLALERDRMRSASMCPAAPRPIRPRC